MTVANWTREQALKVLESGDNLRVTHPLHAEQELIVRHTLDGRFAAYTETILGTDDEGFVMVEGPEFEKCVGYFEWGTFEIVGWDLMGGIDDEIPEDDERWQEFKRTVLDK